MSEDKAACPVLTAERMRQLADRLDIEYRHLDAHPGTIMRRSRDTSTEELRDVRERYQVIHATHTLLLLASYASELRYWADQADNAVLPKDPWCGCSDPDYCRRTSGVKPPYRTERDNTEGLAHHLAETQMPADFNATEALRQLSERDNTDSL